MARRIGSVTNESPLLVLLMCGCRMAIWFTAVWERKEFECVWHTEHGSQAWVSFDFSEYGYRVECRSKGCGVKRNYNERFLAAHTFAESHSRIHCHKVRLFAGDWVGREIVPVTLADEVPF